MMKKIDCRLEDQINLDLSSKLESIKRINRQNSQFNKFFSASASFCSLIISAERQQEYQSCDFTKLYNSMSCDLTKSIM